MLPLRPRPKLEESFGSWVQRVAIANGLTFEQFVSAIRERYIGIFPRGAVRRVKNSLTYPSPDRVEHEFFVAMMAAASGHTESELKALALESRSRGYRRRFLVPSGRVTPSVVGGNRNNAPWYPDSYCPLCMVDGFFLRRLWRVAFLPYCVFHERALIKLCPRCGSDLDYYGVKTRQHHVSATSKLLCGGCGLDQTLIPGAEAPLQHRAAIRYLGELLEGSANTNPPEWREQILGVFHRWCDAFFETCTPLSAEPSTPRANSLSQHRKRYVYQPPEVRFALLTIAFRTMGRLSQGGSTVHPIDVACLKWMGPTAWGNVLDIAGSFLDWFPELDDQETFVAPDSSVLPLRWAL